MTAVYAPLQNASSSQRGAISTAAQDIPGAKHFLDTLTAEEIVAKWLEVGNAYTEPLTVEALPYTASGVPLSFGGPTTDAAPFWGMRAQSVPLGGSLGTVKMLGLGLFPGDGPTDLLSIDAMPSVLPGLILGTTATGSHAALIATRASLGLTADGLSAALDFSGGVGFLNGPLSLDNSDAVLRSTMLPVRFNNGTANVAELRHAANTTPPTFGAGVEWRALSGPAAFARAVAGSFADGVVAGPITDTALGALANGVHLVAPFGESRVATFGWYEAGDYTSAARIHKSGAYEVSRPDMGAADEGVVLGSGTHGQQISFSVAEASGSITPPSSADVESITINSPAILAGSIPRVEVIGQPITSVAGNRPTIVLESVAAGTFTFTFRDALSPSTPTAWAPGGSGSIRWEVAR